MKGKKFTLKPIADKRGFHVFLCLLENQSIPLSPTLKKIDQEISKYSFEHFIIYASQLDNTQKWQWVKKEANQPLTNRIVEYSHHKKEALLQILDTIYNSIGDFKNGIANVYFDEKQGYINLNGKWIFGPF